MVQYLLKLKSTIEIFLLIDLVSATYLPVKTMTTNDVLKIVICENTTFKQLQVLSNLDRA